MCKSDPVVGMLKNIGYVIVRLPRTNIRPLQVMEKDGSNFIIRGDLSQLFTSSTPLPTVSPEVQAGDVEGKRTGELKIGVGLNILGGIIGAMGGSNLGINTSYNQAKTATFEFHDVKQNNIDVFSLESYLNGADVSTSNPGSAKLLDADKLFVITSTIKSAKYTFDAKRDGGVGVSVDVPVIQEAVGGKVSVTKASGSDTKVTYTGQQPLVFGLTAVQMIFDHGKFQLLKEANPSDAATKGISFGDNGNQEEFQVLHSDAPFIPLQVETE
jgi:hypothetical protein